MPDITKRPEKRKRMGLHGLDDDESSSPFIYIVLIVFSIFFYEYLTMGIISIFPPLSSNLNAVLDSTILVLLLSPAIYVLIFRPLNSTINSQRSLKNSLLVVNQELMASHEKYVELNRGLELQVAERTAELDIYIRQLQEEMVKREVGEAELLKSEERFRSIIEAAKDAIILTDQAGRIILFNPGAKTLFGYEVDEVLNRTVSILMPERYRSDHEKGLDRIVSTGKTNYIGKTLEFHGLRKDGTEFPLELNVTKWTTREGIFFSGIIRDITERKEAEEVIKESEERYRNLVERANDGITIIQDGKVMFANQHLVDMWGGELEEIIGNTFVNFVHPKALPEVAKIYGRRMAGEEVPSIYEAILLDKEGNPIYAELNAGVIKYKDMPADLVFVRDITERKKAERELKKSEEKFKDIFENSTDAIFILDMKGNFLDINRTAHDRLGYTKEELLAKHISELDPPEFAERVHERMKLIQKHGQMVFESAHFRKDGTVMPVEINSRVMEYEGQMAFFSVIRDITERKEALNEIKRTTRALRTLSKANEALVHSTDEMELLNAICGIIFQVGEYPLAWIGYAEDDAEKSVRPVAWAGFEGGYIEKMNLTWADEPRGRGPTGRAIRTGEPQKSDDILTDPYFKPWQEEALKRGFRSSVAFPLDINGKIIGAMNIYSSEPNSFDAEELDLLIELARDISFGINTIRTHIEKEGYESNLYELYQIQTVLFELIQISLEDISLQEMLQYALDIIMGIPWFAIKTMGSILLVDEKNADVLNTVAQRNLAKPLLTKCKTVPFGWCMCGRAAATGEIQFSNRIDERHDTTFDGISPHGHYCVPLKSQGRVIGVVNLYLKEGHESSQKEIDLINAVSHVLVGVINRKSAEEKLNLAYDELKTLDSFKGDIISNVSHELRTPIAIVQGALQIMDGETANKEYQELIDMALKALDRQNSIITDLLEAVKLGQEDISKISFDISRTLNEICFEYIPIMDNNNIEFDHSIMTSGANIIGDESKFKHVLRNLLKNAMKFTGKGGEISLQAGIIGDNVEICITDTGIGIPEGKEEKIFDRFFQGDASATRRYGGTGLGLAICKEIVEGHGGRIWARNNPDGGSIFCLSLPVE